MQPQCVREAQEGELGDDVAPIQMTRLQLSEAKQAGGLRAAAKDVMVRVMRAELPEGWARVAYLNASAFASWGAPMKWASVADDVIAAVGERLNASAPVGWKPTDSGDAVIAAVIDDCWPD